MKLNVCIALAESFPNAYLIEAKEDKITKVIDGTEMPLTRVHIFTNILGTYQNGQTNKV